MVVAVLPLLRPAVAAHLWAAAVKATGEAAAAPQAAGAAAEAEAAGLGAAGSAAEMAERCRLDKSRTVSSSDHRSAGCPHESASSEKPQQRTASY